MLASVVILGSLVLPVGTAQDPRSAPELTAAQKREKRIAALIEEVEAQAASEAPQLAIDTLLRLSQRVRSRDRAKAVSLLQLAKEKAAALRSEFARGNFLSLVGQQMAELDPVQAEEICKAIPAHREPEYESDPRTACWVTRIEKEAGSEVRLEASQRAFSQRAFATRRHAETLAQLQKNSLEEANAFVSSYLAAFPARDASPGEIRGLLDLLRAAGPEQPQLSRQGLELALALVERNDFPEPKQPAVFRTQYASTTIETKTTQETLALQVADLAWLIAPDLLESHTSSLGKWRDVVSSGDWQRRRITRTRASTANLDPSMQRALGLSGMNLPNLDGLDHATLENLLTSSQDPRVRMVLRIQLLNESTPGSAEAKKLIRELRESLAETPNSSPLKLMAVYLLFDEALDRRAFVQAAEYGKLLSECFEASLSCDSADCEDAAVDMEPGDLIWLFLSHMRAREHSPAALGVAHRSVDARQRLVELEALLKEREGRTAPNGERP